MKRSGPGTATVGKECCGLPMSTLDVFGIRLYQCMYRGHHPLVFRNLSTGEELTESYCDGDGRPEVDVALRRVRRGPRRVGMA